MHILLWTPRECLHRLHYSSSLQPSKEDLIVEETKISNPKARVTCPKFGHPALGSEHSKPEIISKLTVTHV